MAGEAAKAAQLEPWSAIEVILDLTLVSPSVQPSSVSSVTPATWPTTTAGVSSSPTATSSPSPPPPELDPCEYEFTDTMIAMEALIISVLVLFAIFLLSTLVRTFLRAAKVRRRYENYTVDVIDESDIGSDLGSAADIEALREETARKRREELDRFYDIRPVAEEQPAAHASLAKRSSRGGSRTISTIPEDAEEHHAEMAIPGSARGSSSGLGVVQQRRQQQRVSVVSTSNGWNGNLLRPPSHSGLYRTNSQEIVDQMTRFVLNDEDTDEDIYFGSSSNGLDRRKSSAGSGSIGFEARKQRRMSMDVTDLLTPRSDMSSSGGEASNNSSRRNSLLHFFPAQSPNPRESSSSAVAGSLNVFSVHRPSLVSIHSAHSQSNASHITPSPQSRHRARPLALTDSPLGPATIAAMREEKQGKYLKKRRSLEGAHEFQMKRKNLRKVMKDSIGTIGRYERRNEEPTRRRISTGLFYGSRPIEGVAAQAGAFKGRSGSGSLGSDLVQYKRQRRSGVTFLQSGESASGETTDV